MDIDLNVGLMHATVQLEQPLGNGSRTVGTGFLVNAPDAEGRPRTVLITANHVLERMPGQQMRIGYRIQGEGGTWKYDPQMVPIRTPTGAEKWAHNAGSDVAAIAIEVPEAFAKAAIPLSWLADGEAFDRYGVGPGAEMMVLGYPQGYSANTAGFPILRSGRVASYPLAPSASFPTFLLDFSVFPGNSGGPVFTIVQPKEEGAPRQMVTGILTQQLEGSGAPLEIGVVTQAAFIRQTLALLDIPGAYGAVRSAEAGPGYGPMQPVAVTASAVAR